MKSYLADRTKSIQISGIFTEATNLICRVPQGSVLGPLQILHLHAADYAIMQLHTIQYHIYADDT